MEKFTPIILLVAPTVIIVLVLGWLIIASSRRKHVRLRLAGLGIKIDVDTSDTSLAPTESTTHTEKE